MPNANTDWQRRPLQDAGLNGPAYINDRLGKAIEPAEQFVNGITLPFGDQGGDGHANAVTQFAIERVIGAENRDAILFEETAYLEIGIAHLQTEGFSLVRTGHDAAVVISE